MDGSKVKANTSMAKNRTKEQLDKELRDYVEKIFAEVERIDKEEDKLYGEENDGFSLPAHLRDRKERIREGLRQLKEEEDKRKAEGEIVGRPPGDGKGRGRERKGGSRTEAGRERGGAFPPQYR